MNERNVPVCAQRGRDAPPDATVADGKYEARGWLAKDFKIIVTHR
jgi:hypothetical protein